MNHFKKGIMLFSKVPSSLCPVSAMLAYLLVRVSQAGPLSLSEDGRLLTWQRFVLAVCHDLLAAGIQANRYAGHSFQIGAVMVAAARGCENFIIKTHGQWKSLAYSHAMLARALYLLSCFCLSVYYLCIFLYVHHWFLLYCLSVHLCCQCCTSLVQWSSLVGLKGPPLLH